MTSKDDLSEEHRMDSQEKQLKRNYDKWVGEQGNSSVGTQAGQQGYQNYLDEQARQKKYEEDNRRMMEESRRQQEADARRERERRERQARQQRQANLKASQPSKSQTKRTSTASTTSNDGTFNQGINWIITIGGGSVAAYLAAAASGKTIAIIIAAIVGAGLCYALRNFIKWIAVIAIGILILAQFLGQ